MEGITMQRIYLDNAAATILDKRVLDAMMPYLTTQYGNPSSLHYYGQQARAAVQQARHQIAHCLGVEAQDIIFTSGGTEADNLAILGYLKANYPEGGHIITTAVEHDAVLHTFQALAEGKYDVTILPVDSVGRVSGEAVQEALRPDTVLISVMYANNETGMIQPVRDIGMVAKKAGIAFHVDAVQALGYVPIKPQDENIDLLTICSHKIYGPKGIGALYVRQGLDIMSEGYGGPQEHHLRAGTENVAAIVGFGTAAALLETERQSRARHAYGLKRFLYDKFITPSSNVRLNGAMACSLPNIINFSIRGMDNDVLLIAMDTAGVAVSAGSACEAGALEPSHVLAAMGTGEEWIHGSIRVSVGKENTMAEMEQAIVVMQSILDTAQGGKHE
jgi:cysteine desulfurase